MSLMFDTLGWAPFDTLEFDALNNWTDGIRTQLVVPPPNVPYQSLMSLATNSGTALTNPIAVSEPVAVYNPASVSTLATTDMTESAKESGSATTDENDISSTEGDDDDLISGEDADDDTSSAQNDDLSSAENYSDDISSLERDNDDLATAPAHNGEPTSDNITNFRPKNERPNISREFSKESTVASKLPGFLAQIRAANQELEEEQSAGTLASRRIEIDENDSAAEGEQHIVLNLGLGVLEEKGYEASTTTESDSSSGEGDSDIMEKLLGCKRKRGLENDDEAVSKKVKIQEV